ncbi:hypothetical protein [Streptomyces sp. BP-8]|uniref:Uncharacterized protein n=1 Tax=Streptomyces sirii TaxID=3127701 RepID=A0ABZ2QX48_9ACTN
MAMHNHFSNDASQNVYVVLAMNPEWLAADFVADLGLMAVGIGELKAATSVTTLPETIATLKDAYTLFKLSAGVLGGTISVGGRSAEATKAAVELITKFKENAIKIEPDQTVDVRDSSLWELFNLSGWAALLGASTVSMLVMTEDGKHVAQFNSGEDDSWIATDEKVVRAKYGTLHEPDPSQGEYVW